VTLVVDASVVVTALVDSGSDGGWARALLRGEDLTAPPHM
jgi:predicted nucleic acid-binding protein